MNMAKETEIQAGVSVFGGPAKAQEPLPPLLPTLPSQEVMFDAAAIVEAIGNLESALRDLGGHNETELQGLAKGQADTDRRLDALEEAAASWANQQPRLDKLEELTASLLASASGVQERLHQLQSQSVQTAANHIDQAQTVSRCCKELAELGKELELLRYCQNGTGETGAKLTETVDTMARTVHRLHAHIDGMEEQLRAQRDKLAKQEQGLEAVYGRLPALRGPQE